LDWGVRSDRMPPAHDPIEGLPAHHILRELLSGADPRSVMQSASGKLRQERLRGQHRSGSFLR